MTQFQTATDKKGTIVINTINGTTEECLVHFSDTHQEQLKKDRCRIRNKICALINVGDSTGYRWFGEKIMPSGINLLKLQLLLELVGYTITERESIPKLQRDLANQIAFLLVSIEDVGKYMGVTYNTVLRWITNQVLPEQKEVLLTEFLELHKTEADEKLRHWQTVLQGLHLTSVQPTKQVVPVVSVLKREIDRSLHSQMIDTLAHLIMIAKPLAENILSDVFTEQEREQLRQKTQVVRSNGVFDLSNLLNRLCSERARNEIKPQTTNHKKG